MVQFPEKRVDMDTVTVADNWARMTTLTKPKGDPKTVRELGEELARAFGKCKPCREGWCKHQNTCKFEKDQRARVGQALEALAQKHVRQFTTKRQRDVDCETADDFLLA